MVANADSWVFFHLAWSWSVSNLIKWGVWSLWDIAVVKHSGFTLNQWYLHENESWPCKSSDVTNWPKFGHLQHQKPSWEHKFKYLIGSWNCELNTFRRFSWCQGNISHILNWCCWFLKLWKEGWWYSRSSHWYLNVPSKGYRCHRWQT
jgi:hypothetical protein